MNTLRIATVASAAALLVSCVDHRPVRNGLADESSYIEKMDLTTPNTKIEGTEDDGWLYQIKVTGVSAPNIVGAIPGDYSSVKYVKFRFRQDALQVVDGQELQIDDPENENDDDLYTQPRVVLEFPGKHVDVKLRESLDGERTNWLEENTERDWQERQSFKLDWEKATLNAHDAMGAIGGYFTAQCGSVMSQRLVPDSYIWDKEDQYLSFSVEVNYRLDLNRYLCYSWAYLGQHVFDTNVIDSGTVVYKFNFYRRGESSYEPDYVEEKAPVNKKYGVFQQLNLFIDSGTGLLGGKTFTKRWNPNTPSTEPVTYYFAKGFPPKFKDIFTDEETGIAARTNKIMEDAGASLRFQFVDYDHDGVEREVGDMRYAFVIWWQNQAGNGGILGLGPHHADPRTGEVFSADVNMYNYAYDIFRFYMEEYLADAGAVVDLDADCEPGSSATPTTEDGELDQTGRLDSALFNEMRFVMDLPEDKYTGTPSDFVPTAQADTFRSDYHRIIPETRYGYPGWNPYVYQTIQKAPVAHMADMMATEVEYREAMNSIIMGDNPFDGLPLHTREGIEAQNQFRQNFRRWKKNHMELKAQTELINGSRTLYNMDEGDFLDHLRRSARQCTDEGAWETDEEYSARVLKGIITQLAFHEFGHTISLRHNFFGSMDEKHRHEGAVTASVMDYVDLQAESGAPANWGGYDELALKWIFGTESVRKEVMKEDPLYCTDEHRIFSPLCRAYDFGTTPSEIVLNEIESYDWGYEFRNRRAFRQFWNVGGYTGRVFNSLFGIQRMWYLALFDWGGGGVQEVMKRLDQTQGKDVLTQAQYDERSVDFYNDVVAANAMMMAFYDGIINQSASFRNYQTEFDPFYGDIRRIGIIIDKLYATFGFMDLQDVTYSPNISTYVAMFDAPFGSQNQALSQRVLDNFLGSNYDTFPWFRYYALNIYAAVTNTNLVGNATLKERIGIWRFNNAADMYERFSQDEIEQALRPDNPQQTFIHNGEEYVYTLVVDRQWHLVSGRSRNPVAFQFIRDYNESLNGGASASLDNYGLKILLAYHEYYNNFVGF